LQHQAQSNKAPRSAPRSSPWLRQNPDFTDTVRLPQDIAKASQSFAREVRENGGDLGDEWLNNGPASLQKQLPPGWEVRLQTAFFGRAIQLRTLAREDLLCAKLFALCERGIDLLDCVALSPDLVELDKIIP